MKNRKIQDMIRNWKSRIAEYESESLKQLKVNNPWSSNRYEGISKGTRWCLEDLEKMLKE